MKIPAINTIAPVLLLLNCAQQVLAEVPQDAANTQKPKQAATAQQLKNSIAAQSPEHTIAMQPKVGLSDEIDRVSPLLQSEFAQTGESATAINNNLFQMSPPGNGDLLNFSLPDEKSLLSVGPKRLPPIKLEATYNQTLTLRAALEQALSSNLPIKISEDLYKSKRALFWGATGRFLPDLSMTYRAQNTYQSSEKLLTTKTGNTTLTWAYFQGGRVFNGMMENFYTARAAKSDLNTSTNDVLLSTYRNYNEVLLNQALLKVRTKSLETSRANLRLTKQQFDAGVGTKFAVMQSETQLANDMQSLLTQQLAVRRAAIALSVTLNAPIDVNILPEETLMDKVYILNPNLDANYWTKQAIANRPELKSLEAQRKAAKAAIARVASPLLPVAQLFVSPSNSQTTTAGGNSSGTATGSTGGVNISTSGSGASSIGVGGLAGSSVTLGTSLTWNLGGLGVPDLANIESNRLLARRVLNQYNQQALLVTQEVHNLFLDIQGIEQQINITAETVIASREALRLAFRRLQLGNGTNLELIQAQQSYVDALSKQIRAYIDHRNAQAQLLRNVGSISLENLLAKRQ